MDTFLGITWTEWVGYAASAGVLLSFLMKEMRTLRIVNTVGCFLFIIYGVLLNSIPVIATNTIIVGINIYYLFVKKIK
ncbi:MAG: uroporphyrinogen decarboxylase [Flavobacteriaceae bacterium]|nr:uroporphyrinogen decarboxylase [Flavobacteriaceae bacterium]